MARIYGHVSLKPERIGEKEKVSACGSVAYLCCK